MRLSIVYEGPEFTTSERLALDPDGRWWVQGQRGGRWTLVKQRYKSRPLRSSTNQPDGPWVVGAAGAGS